MYLNSSKNVLIKKFSSLNLLDKINKIHMIYVIYSINELTMAFEKYTQMFREMRSEKNRITQEQKEQFKRERMEVYNIINKFSDKWKKLCIEFLTYDSSKFKENDIIWENEEETTKIKKVFNIIKWRNYYTKARLANKICTQYNIKSILLYGVHNIGNKNIKHDQRTFEHIKYMSEKWKSVLLQEYDEDVVKPRAKKEREKEEKNLQEAMMSCIDKFKKIFDEVSDEWKIFCMGMLKKSEKLLKESTVITDNKEEMYQEETNKLNQALLYIILIDVDIKEKLKNELSEKYNILINKKSNHKWPRKLSKRKYK